MEVNHFIAFISGIVSFFAPCVVPLLPAYLGYVTGVSLKELKDKQIDKRYRRQIWISSILYILGFSLVFVLLGTTVASLGRFFREYEQAIQIVGGLVIMFFALTFMDLIHFKWLAQERKLQLPRWTEHLGYARAFFVGVIFATAWTPCVGAILGAILTLAAASSTAVTGASLLFVYSLGISVPFLLLSLMLSQVPSLIKNIRKPTLYLSRVGGVMLLVIGFLMFNNNLKLIAPWLTYDRLNGVFFQWETQIRRRLAGEDGFLAKTTDEYFLDEDLPKVEVEVKINENFIVGQQAPSITTKNFSGEMVELEEFYGQKAVLLDFWAGWCPFCVEEMPMLQELNQAYGDQLEVVGVHRTETEDLEYGQWFAQQREVEYSLLIDDGQLYQAAGGIGMPVAVYIDADGVVQRIKNGPKTKEEMLEQLAEMGVVVPGD